MLFPSSHPGRLVKPNVAAWLPSRQSSANFDTGLAGFDVLLIVALAGHAWFALGRSLCMSTARNCRGRTARRRCVVSTSSQHHRTGGSNRSCLRRRSTTRRGPGPARSRNL